MGWNSQFQYLASVLCVILPQSNTEFPNKLQGCIAVPIILDESTKITSNKYCLENYNIRGEHHLPYLICFVITIKGNNLTFMKYLFSQAL